MRRTLTRELPSAKAIRAMLGAAPVQSDKPPALERRAADRDSMPPVSYTHLTLPTIRLV